MNMIRMGGILVSEKEINQIYFGKKSWFERLLAFFGLAPLK